MGLEQLGSLLSSGGGGGGGGNDPYSRFYYDMLKTNDQRAYEQQQANSIAGLVDKLYGNVAQPEVTAPMGAGEQDLFPGEAPIPGLSNITQEAQQASGILGSGRLNPIQQLMMEREKAMLGSGMTSLQEAALGDQNILMKSMLPDAPGMSGAGKMAMDAGHTPGTPGFADFVRRYAFKPPSQTTVDMSGADRIKVSEAKDMMYPDRSPVQPGTPWEAVLARGGKLRNALPSDAAGKVAMIDTALEEYPDIEGMLFRPDGTLDEEAINVMSMMNVAPGGQAGHAAAKGLASMKYGPEAIQRADQLANKYEFAMQGITRLETGAAMPPEEVQNTRIRFQPFFGESPEVIKQKYRALGFFLKLAKEKLDPTITDSQAHTAQVKRLADEAEKMARESEGPAIEAPVPQGMGTVIME